MIEVRESPIHGRGTFASGPIRKGETFHTAHLLVFDCGEADAIERTAAAHYVFHIEDCAVAPDKAVTGLAMSPISFVNHHRPPDASFAVDGKARTVSFTALRDIGQGEEITIDYGDFAEKLGIS